jgi:TrmH family RNA methyltransferase
MPQISNNEIKKVKSLQQKKFRDEYGLFVVEGEKMVAEAFNSRFHVENIYKRDEIGEESMKRISALANPSPALAVVRKPSNIELDLKDYESELPSKGLFLGLDSMRDPGNLGTVLRIAEWFGIEVIYASKDTVDIFNPKVVQATMGAIFRVKFHYVDLPEMSKFILSKGGSVYGTFLDGENIYTRTLHTGEHSPVMIVIGNESEGISPAMEEHVTDRLYIPPFPADQPGSESLNAAVATAVTVAEFRRLLQTKA